MVTLPLAPLPLAKANGLPFQKPGSSGAISGGGSNGPESCGVKGFLVWVPVVVGESTNQGKKIYIYIYYVYIYKYETQYH